MLFKKESVSLKPKTTSDNAKKPPLIDFTKKDNSNNLMKKEIQKPHWITK